MTNGQLLIGKNTPGAMAKLGWWLGVSSCLLFALPAQAYVGPGAGLSMLGALWAVILAILFALTGLLVWPIRMLLRRQRNTDTISSEAEAGKQEGGNG